MENNGGKCIIFSAPSGAGKTTIVRFLLSKFDKLSFSVSATSRDRRSYEADGLHYYFMSADAFRKKVEEDSFLEWEEVYTDQYYGTLKSEMKRIWNSGKHVIFDVDVVGGVNLKRYFGDKALAIFVQPPSIEVLEDRLRKRSTETEETLLARLSKAEHEMTFSKHFDKILINDNLDKACADACEMVKEFIES
ncbi:guanylate kinase [Cryomorpha ignava]|uniref:Guanylate kinase n=1 Tax=Cryomorpha ignava TaxID=101383 RepID=A0A7K3WSM7_9FLAO|nr:guanylate kinase [Cryomorpha ignava]NEN23882.1 guanylate kinase [Cryomorpha ignava]